MNPTPALAAIAAYLGNVSELKGAYYPAPRQLGPTPAAVVYWGGTTGETTITHGSDQLWLMSVLVRLYVTQVGDTPDEIAAGDALIVPVVDAFAAGSDGYRLFTAGGVVDHCRVSSVRPSLTVRYAGQDYYGADLSLAVKLHRFPGA